MKVTVINYHLKFIIIFSWLEMKIQKVLWILSESFNVLWLKSFRNRAASGKL